MDKHFQTQLSAYRQIYDVQYFPKTPLEEWLLMDLLKAFDYVQNHHFLFGNLPQYGLDEKLLILKLLRNF